MRLVAPAKLTSSLRIVGRRADGYHLIDAEMVTVDLHDSIEVAEGESGVHVDGPAAPGDLRSDNLVAGALELCGRGAGVSVLKRIPAGAGLGGWSADAAAVLRWAGWVDLVAATRLGADVAFCLVGGRARVRGIGEVVDALTFRDQTFTLHTPPVFCSTPAVYERWDQMGGPVDDADADCGGGNDLAAAALSVYPELAGARDRLAEATGLRPRLAGSGSTWFVEGAFPGPGRRVVRTVPAGWSG